MRTCGDRTASRSSRLLPFPCSTVASALAVLANTADVASAVSASALSSPGRSASAAHAGSTSGMPTAREAPHVP